VKIKKAVLEATIVFGSINN